MAPLDIDVTGTFSKMRLAWDALDEARVQRLAEFGKTFSDMLSHGKDDAVVADWLRRLKRLGHERTEVLTALCRAGMWATPSEDVFSPFVGHWMGGDLHDAAQTYHHTVFPAQAKPEFVAQEALLWLPSTSEMQDVYNFCRLGEDDLEITGLLRGRARLGFCLPDGALIWVGEESETTFSVTVEKVWAKDQLFDQRGLVLAADSLKATASDWRFHRVKPHAIQIPKSPKYSA
jgi:hypothetical protein